MHAGMCMGIAICVYTVCHIITTILLLISSTITFYYSFYRAFPPARVSSVRVQHMCIIYIHYVYTMRIGIVIYYLLCLLYVCVYVQ